MEQYLLRLRLAVLRQICSDICRAHEKWREQAYLHGVTIQGAIASGGRAVGPDLGALIRGLPQPAHLGGGLPYVNLFRNAAAVALSNAWRGFEISVTVPALPWYPSFVSLAGSVAPPTPNAPCLLKELTSGSVLADNQIAAAMKTAFGAPVQYSNRMLEALAFAFVTTAVNWIHRQPVQNVLGTGPVVRPLHSPVGTVMGGMVIPHPGVFWDSPPGTGPIRPSFA
jgi:hypothetical protein